MEISVPINEINTRNIYFGEKRKNIIVDGDFVKIIYSTDSFEMNGLYILTEFYLRDSKGISKENTCIPIPNTKCSMSRMYFAFSLRRPDGSSTACAENPLTPNTKCATADASHPELFADYEKQQDHIYIEDQNEVKSASDVRGEWVKIVNKNTIIPPKRNIILNILTKENAQVIEKLCQIESEIVDRYIANNCPSKTASYVLKNQLLSGSIKYHSENFVVEFPRTPHTKCSTISEAMAFFTSSKTHFLCDSQVKEECILKISGIWETTLNVGITMKFILLQNCF
jgi:hypothetical protein